MGGRDRRLGDRLAAAIERAEQLGNNPVGRLLGIDVIAEQRVEPARGLDLGREDAGVEGVIPSPS